MPSSIVPVFASHVLACASLSVAGDNLILPPVEMSCGEFFQEASPLYQRLVQ